MSLHLGKTEAILFGSKRKLNKVSSYDVLCNGVSVKRVRSVKYLGFSLDECITGSEHQESVMSKIAGRLSFLYRHSRVLNGRARVTLCSSLIQPHMDYCCSAWYSGLSVRLKGRLDILQRKMARFCLFMGPRDHIGLDELRNLSWLSIPRRVDYFKILHVYRILNCISAGYLNGSYGVISGVHDHGTRSATGGDIYLPNNFSSTFRHSFYVTAAKAWNKLPANLRTVSSLYVFRRKLHTFLLNS